MSVRSVKKIRREKCYEVDLDNYLRRRRSIAGRHYITVTVSAMTAWLWLSNVPFTVTFSPTCRLLNEIPPFGPLYCVCASTIIVIDFAFFPVSISTNELVPRD